MKCPMQQRVAVWAYHKLAVWLSLCPGEGLVQSLQDQPVFPKLFHPKLLCASKHRKSIIYGRIILWGTIPLHVYQIYVYKKNLTNILCPYISFYFQFLICVLHLDFYINICIFCFKYKKYNYKEMKYKCKSKCVTVLRI